jgi:hypothetical protein
VSDVETWEWFVIAAGGAAVLVLALALMRIRRRRTRLKRRFGPEYERAVADSGTGAGERRLGEIESRRGELRIQPLSLAARDRYLDEWRLAESRFVSDPREAAGIAERLVERALHERGYPDDDGETLVGLMSVDHPDLAERYRHGHAMLEGVNGRSTEDLRKAMLDFRAVLEDVVQEPAGAVR